MSPSDLLTEGVSLMLFGMGFVFLFLTSLVLVTGFMSKIINRYFPEPAMASAPSVAKSSGQKTTNDEEMVAAISAAIRMHRDRFSNNKNHKR